MIIIKYQKFCFINLYNKSLHSKIKFLKKIYKKLKFINLKYFKICKSLIAIYLVESYLKKKKLSLFTDVFLLLYLVNCYSILINYKLIFIKLIIEKLFYNYYNFIIYYNKCRI